MKKGKLKEDHGKDKDKEKDSFYSHLFCRNGVLYNNQDRTVNCRSENFQVVSFFLFIW